MYSFDFRLIEEFKNISNIAKKNRNIWYSLGIHPHNVNDNFIKLNDIRSKVEWKSSFGGGKAGGIGQQNNSFRVDYGLRDFNQLTFTFSEADDNTYNYINEKRAQYSWQTYALSIKRKIGIIQN